MSYDIEEILNVYRVYKSKEEKELDEIFYTTLTGEIRIDAYQNLTPEEKVLTFVEINTQVPIRFILETYKAWKKISTEKRKELSKEELEYLLRKKREQYKRNIELEPLLKQNKELGLLDKYKAEMKQNKEQLIELNNILYLLRSLSLEKCEQLEGGIEIIKEELETKPRSKH